MTGSCTSRSYRKEQYYKPGYHRTLPPPPDIRKVVLNQATEMVPSSQAPSIRQSANAKEVISSGNTTVIGDYVAAAFSQHDSKWLVQATGNATMNTVLQGINKGDITVDRHYIFIVIGHNQLQSSSKGSVIFSVKQIVASIRNKNPAAKIFFSALLPRPVDNDTVKPLIVKFNRALCAAIHEVQKRDIRVLLLPVQHQFIVDSKPVMQYYNEDGFSLSDQGAACLKKELFRLAGFLQNK